MAKPAKKAPAKAAAKTSPAKKPALKIATSAKAAPAKKSVTNGASPATVVKPSSAATAGTSEAKGFKLIAGVKLPPRVTTPGETQYPFESLDVGVAFFVDSKIDTARYTSVPEASKAQREASAVRANRINGAIRRYLKRNEGKKFTARTVYNGKELGFDGDIGIVVQRTK